MHQPRVIHQERLHLSAAGYRHTFVYAHPRYQLRGFRELYCRIRRFSVYHLSQYKDDALQPAISLSVRALCKSTAELSGVSG